MPELDPPMVTFHYRGIPKTQDELAEKNTTNRVFEYFTPTNFGVQVQSKAFD